MRFPRILSTFAIATTALAIACSANTSGGGMAVAWEVGRSRIFGPVRRLYNKNGTHMTITDNGPSPTGAQSTIASAGIEAAYADLKNLTIPAARF